MCSDICTVNIRVSIRVRGLHLVPYVLFVVRLAGPWFNSCKHQATLQPETMDLSILQFLGLAHSCDHWLEVHLWT